MEATSGSKRRERKKKYKERLEQLLVDYRNILVIGVDNVGSHQMQKIRIKLRGKAVVIMGKNTMMRMIIKAQSETNPKLEGLLELIRGNVGLCLTNGDLQETRAVLTEERVPAAAKTGTMAPSDVFVPAGPTGLDPGQTLFFQALNIATKIARGAIEITTDVHLIKQGEKVTTSAVALLSKLDIKPFFYGVVVLQVYENGSIYPVKILDMTKEDLLTKFVAGVRKVAALSLAIGYPTAAAVPHALANGFGKLLAISFATNYSFAERERLLKASQAAGASASGSASGSGSASAAAAGGAGDKKGGKKGPPKEEPKKEEPPAEEEEDAGGGFSDLFGGGGD